MSFWWPQLLHEEDTIITQVLQFYRLDKWFLKKLNTLYKAEIQTRYIVKKLIRIIITHQFIVLAILLFYHNREANVSLQGRRMYHIHGRESEVIVIQMYLWMYYPLEKLVYTQTSSDFYSCPWYLSFPLVYHTPMIQYKYTNQWQILQNIQGFVKFMKTVLKNHSNNR